MNKNMIPHVVILPIPLQGPVNCFLKLTELILTLTQPHDDSLVVTFINTASIHRHLARHSDALSRLARFGPRFRYEVVADPVGQDGTPALPGQIWDMTVWFEAQARDGGSRLREVLTYGKSAPAPALERDIVTCVITDGLFGFMVDVGKEIGVGVVYFETVSPCGLWTFLCVPMMVRAGELPFQGDDLDEKITSIPGMEDHLRRRDLPSFCRLYDPDDNVIQLILKESQHFSQAQGQILNTFDDLEGPLMAQLHDHCPNLYNIGPLHLHYKSRVRLKKTSSLSTSNSLWQEDTCCLSWLDAQPPKSVLFVSIGSVAVMAKHQLVELWHGLVNSETRFLWVRRPGSIIDEDDDGLEVPIEVLEGTGPVYIDRLSSDKFASQVQNPASGTDRQTERGFLASWVPQGKVLAHRAIGGFLTHSGWNSTLESIVEGVPMICWPFSVDQQVNSRFVEQVWQVGLDMKDTCDRVVIEKAIRDLMGSRRDEFAAKASDLAKLGAQAVDENGSSFCDLNRLIEDIQLMRLSIPSKN